MFIHFLLWISPAVSFIMPLTKSDGSMDISSIINHISLLEQTIESQKIRAVKITVLETQFAALKEDRKTDAAEIASLKSERLAAQRELGAVKGDLKSAQADILLLKFQSKTSQPSGHDHEDLAKLKADVELLKSQCADNQTTTPHTGSSSDILKLTSDVKTLQNEYHSLDSRYNIIITGIHNTTSDGGTSYIRWGRTSCPTGSELVYEGIAGGTRYSSSSGSSTILCLPKQPMYAEHDYAHHAAADIYGVEYGSSNVVDSFKHLNYEDMPCAVCYTPTKRTAIMVPARNRCLPGWDLEYWGYLMGTGDHQASGEYICVDSQPQAIPGGGNDEGGKYMYLVESACKPLPCPPYTSAWELTCCVCSR